MKKHVAAALTALVLVFGCANANRMVHEAAPINAQRAVANAEIKPGLGRVVCSLGKFSWAQMDEAVEVYVNDLKIGTLGNKGEILAVDLYPQVYSLKWKLLFESTRVRIFEFPMAVSVKEGEVVYLLANLKSEGISDIRFEYRFQQVSADLGAEWVKTRKLILLDEVSRDKLAKPVVPKEPVKIAESDGIIDNEKRRGEESEAGKYQKEKKDTAESRSVPEGSRIQERDAPASFHLVGSGTGFFINERGHILTNEHVVNGCRALQVRTHGGHGQYAKVLYVDAETDLAVIEVDPFLARQLMGWGGQTVRFRLSDKTRLGEGVVVYGFPLAATLASEGNVTTGNITALSGLRGDARRYQISAPVQLGNSGGPLFDERGLVIGVVVSKLDALKTAVNTGDIPQNVNFAIKIEIAASFLSLYQIPYVPSKNEPQKRLTAPDVAENAQKITVRVDCFK